MVSPYNDYLYQLVQKRYFFFTHILVLEIESNRSHVNSTSAENSVIEGAAFADVDIRAITYH